MGDGGGVPRGALMEALREAVESREPGAGAPGPIGRGSAPSPSSRRPATGGVVLVDDSDLPPIRPGSGAGRSRDLLETLGGLPLGWLWKGLWLAGREGLWLLTAFWSLAVLGGFLLPSTGVATVAATAVTLRAVVALLRALLRRGPAGAPSAGPGALPSRR